MIFSFPPQVLIGKFTANYHQERLPLDIEEFQDYLTFVATYFPNIHTLNIEVNINEWESDRALEIFESINADIFEEIPSSVKGYMEFKRPFSVERYSQEYVSISVFRFAPIAPKSSGWRLFVFLIIIILIQFNSF